MSSRTPAVLSLFSIHPTRIGGTETFARELSSQIGAAGWHSVVSTLSAPPDAIARFLLLPNVTLETCACATVTARSLRELAGILRRHRPRILHLHYIGLVTPYPWLVEVLVLDGSSYRLAGTHTKGDTLESPSFADLRMDLDKVFDFPIDPGEEIQMVKEGHPPYAREGGGPL